VRGWDREGREWGGKRGEMTQTLYAHMNKRKKMTQTLYAHMNKRKKKTTANNNNKKGGADG
jgi:hypothetical protein